MTLLHLFGSQGPHGPLRNSPATLIQASLSLYPRSVCNQVMRLPQLKLPAESVAGVFHTSSVHDSHPQLIVAGGGDGANVGGGVITGVGANVGLEVITFVGDNVGGGVMIGVGGGVSSFALSGQNCISTKSILEVQ